MARLGTRQSPMLKGGGKSFGPHPRDFATGLPRKMYDLAWRTALSYRYRKGELIVCEDGMEIEEAESGYISEIFKQHGWGRRNGRSTVITSEFSGNLFTALEESNDGRALLEKQVDVKDLLETGRIIIEQSALDTILKQHRSDLIRAVARG
jgi:large subunit ribosomal protein L4